MNTSYAIANFTITFGYLILAVAVVPHIAVARWWVKTSGAFFFITCGLTHVEMGMHAFLRSHHFVTTFGLMNHIVQAIAVLAFVAGIYLEVTATPGKSRL